MSTQFDPEPALTAAQLLRWYLDMGVDIAVDDTPHNRFAESVAKSASAQREVIASSATSAVEKEQQSLRAPLQRLRATPSTEPVAVFAATETMVQSARAAAEEARNLAELGSALQTFDAGALKNTATHLVFSGAPVNAAIMLVGEAPRADEDRSGVPFSGAAGRLLDNMLKAIGLDRTHVHLAHIIPWRPPGDRAVTVHEMAICLPFIIRQIELVAPKILVCLGGTPVQILLETREVMVRARGRWFEFERGTQSIPSLAMLNPAKFMDQPAQKRNFWRDLRDLRQKLDELSLSQPQ